MKTLTRLISEMFQTKRATDRRQMLDCAICHKDTPCILLRWTDDAGAICPSCNQLASNPKRGTA